MYNQEKRSWLKHMDFMIIDILGLMFALLVAYVLRKGGLHTSLEKDFWHMALIIMVVDVVVVFFMESYSGIVLRGYLKELKASIIHVCSTMMCFILFNYLYLITASPVWQEVFIFLLLRVVFCKSRFFQALANPAPQPLQPQRNQVLRDTF